MRRRLDLVGLRHLFIHTGVALTELSLAVQWSFDAERRSVPPLVWLVAVGIVGYEVGALAWIGRRSLSARSRQELADRFRARSLIQLGLAAAPAMYGIGGSYLIGRPELSWLGTLLSLLLLAWVAPSRSQLDRLDQELRASGSASTVRGALADTA